jgi:D-lactate dehydrogenase
MKTAFYSIHNFEKLYLLQANKTHELVFIEQRLDEETAILAKGCTAASLFVTDFADAGVLQKLAVLGIRYITLRSAGYDNIDLHEARRLGLRVARVARYSPSAVAEHAIALMLALNRKLIIAHEQTRQFNFRLDGLTGFDMKEKTVGIIGTGRIGSQVAHILNGFGCRVTACDVTENDLLKKKISIEYLSLNEVLNGSDIITLHTPLTPETKYIIRAETIKKMKKGVMLINTGRGALLNTADVIAGLDSGNIGYLGLDVYEHEEGLFFEDHSHEPHKDKMIETLMAYNNVIITGHQAFLTATALENIARVTMDNLECFGSLKHSENILV